MTRRTIPGLFGVLCASCMFLCSCERSPSSGSAPPAAGDKAAQAGTHGATGMPAPPVEPRSLRGTLVPDPDHTITVSLRAPGLLVSVLKRVGESVNAGDVIAEVDSMEVGRLVYELRSLEAEHIDARARVAAATNRVESLLSDLEFRTAEAAIAEEQVFALRGAQTAETDARLTDTRMLAIRLRGQARNLEFQLAEARRDVTTSRERADAILRAALALRPLIGPQAEIPGTQGRWTAELDRPNIVRLVAPRSGRVVGVLAQTGEGLPAGAGVVRIADPARAAVMPDAESAAALAAWTGRRVRLQTGANPPIAVEGTVVVSFSEGGDPRAWVTCTLPEPVEQPSDQLGLQPAPPHGPSRASPLVMGTPVTIEVIEP